MNRAKMAELLRAAWCKGYDQGHNDGLSCGHPLASHCRHESESEVDDAELDEIIAALEAENPIPEGWENWVMFQPNGSILGYDQAEKLWRILRYATPKTEEGIDKA